MREFLKAGKTTLVQSELNREVKEKKRKQRQKRVIAKEKPKKDAAERRQRVGAEITKEVDSESASRRKKET